MKNFRFDTSFNITQEAQELNRFNNASGFIGKSAVIKYHELLSKVILKLFRVLTGYRVSAS